MQKPGLRSTVLAIAAVAALLAVQVMIGAGAAGAFTASAQSAVGEVDGRGDDRPDVRPDVPPEQNRFVKTVFERNLNEPMELDLLPDGRLLFVERGGDIHTHDPATGRTDIVATLDVFTEYENGLLGVALDPNYAANHWVYFFYSDPEASTQNISRFRLRDGRLEKRSEQVLLRVPTDRKECCHSAGALEFDKHGNLFISVGDDTNPFASDGYAPLDEREGRRQWDAQRSSANTDDLRGKILRIHPERDGSYSIPHGNLFEDGAQGRPEIYVMGNRNPFRFSIDDETGYLYWGEVGPDAGTPSRARGPAGHDEINQARRAGFFGWPYFIGDNKRYHAYDFADSLAGAPFDPQVPLNGSVNNTGARQLPPAQPAFIWYPYGASPEFPSVGTGGRTAMAGPVYHVPEEKEGAWRGFPSYYDGKLFIYEWVRGWVMAVTMDESGDFEAMEPVMTEQTFSKPMDMLFGPEGSLYVLEYGADWNKQNLDARLSRIDFVRGNRRPVARITADTTVGATPLTVQFSAEESADLDGDALRYAWRFDGSEEVQSTEATPTFTFTSPGLYQPTLTVTDTDGKTATAQTDVMAGNAMPQLRLRLDGNTTFFWDEVPLDYAVEVTDAEDGTLGEGIDSASVHLAFSYLAEGYDLTAASAPQGPPPAAAAPRILTPAAAVGQALIARSDCQACHQIKSASVGPAYTAVAEKYQGDANAKAYLVRKIIEGGSGVWGERAMAAHPQLAPEDVGKIVDYILALSETADTAATRPPKGTFTMNQHERGRVNEEGRYVTQASYTDRGAEGIGPLSAQETVVLRPARVQAEAFDGAGGGARAETIPASAVEGEEAFDVLASPDSGYAHFDGLDLTMVGALSARIGFLPGKEVSRAAVRVRLGAPDGPVVGAFELSSGAQEAGFTTYTTPLKETNGRRDLYLTFEEASLGAEEAGVAVDWLHFRHQSAPLPE